MIIWVRVGGVKGWLGGWVYNFFIVTTSRFSIKMFILYNRTFRTFSQLKFCVNCIYILYAMYIEIVYTIYMYVYIFNSLYLGVVAVYS